MRATMFTLFALSFSCAGSAQLRRDPAPEPVVRAEAGVVGVFIDAKCDSLENASASGNGFFVTPRIVATVDHIMTYRRGLFPDFAIVLPDGTCFYAQYADRREDVDLLFLLVHGRSPIPPPDLPIAVPEIGDGIYSISMQEHKSPFRFNRVAGKRIPFLNPKLNKSKLSPVFSATPQRRIGDSGSPAFDEKGRIIGMYQAQVRDKKTNEHTADSFLSGYVIRYFLKACGPCEEE